MSAPALSFPVFCPSCENPFLAAIAPIAGIFPLSARRSSNERQLLRSGYRSASAANRADSFLKRKRFRDRRMRSRFPIR